MMRGVFRGMVVALLAAVAGGCAVNPITGRSQFMVVSEEMAIGSSASAYASMIGQLEKKRQVETGTPRVARVREITDRLIAQAVRFRPDSANWKWEIQVINDPKTVNAFCMAGGKMGIYTGFWEKLKATDDEIAAVMGHEIGHALASHTRERMSVAMGVTVGTAVAAVAVASRNDDASFGRTLTAAEVAAALAITLPNSREGETEADQIGIELAARAGYDPRAAVTLWEKMSKEGSRAPEFLSTHPAPQTRIAALGALVSKVDPLYQAARRVPAAAAPSFLAADGASNERVVGEGSRQAYADRVAREGEMMTFLAEPYARFRRGETRFDCVLGCVVNYGSSKGDWRRLHASASWRDLALAVLRVGYHNDLAYFMLGEAARGLGLPGPARSYYQRALEAGRAGQGCAGAVNTCEGFDVQRRATAALRP